MEKNALVLGGGGARGAYEIGVWQALRELNIPIHIVTGSSVGALNGVLVAQDRYDDAIKIWENMETHMVFDVEEDEKLRRLNTGTSGLEKVIQTYVDEEQVRKSPIDFGLVAVEFPEMKAHKLFVEDIPEGKLHDHILASASFFPALESVDMDGSKFVDGGYSDVLPISLAMQKDPDNMVAVYLDGAGILRKKDIAKAKSQLKSFRFIECQWDLGSILNFDTNNTKRIMRLGYLDAMKSYDKFDGSKFTFEKDIFDKHQLAGAEAAADAFELDPTILYNKKTLKNSLMLAIANSSAAEFNENKLETIKDHFSSGSIVIKIANDLHKKEADSIFISRQAFRILKEEIQAANFLLKMDLV